MGFAKGSTPPPRYRTGLNVGRSGLDCSGLASVTTSTGLVINQSTPAIVMNAAAPIAASPFMLISGEIQACARAFSVSIESKRGSKFLI